MVRLPQRSLTRLRFVNLATGRICAPCRTHVVCAPLPHFSAQPTLPAAAQEKEAREADRVIKANKKETVTVTLPPGAKEVGASKEEIKFTVAKGKAKAAAETLRTEFLEAGWKEDIASLDAMAGALSFSKDKGSLTLHYTDTGVMPSEVDLSAMGASLELR